MKKIPVYIFSIPEYKVKRRLPPSHRVQQHITPWYTVSIPKAYLDHKPNFTKISEKLDRCLKRHFAGKTVAIRALGSQEHKGKSISELIRIIKKIGHDRYDPARRGDRYENLENRQIDIFALDFKVKEGGRYFEHMLESFYFWPIIDRNTPVRVDIVIVYDRKQLTRVPHRYRGRENELKRDGFVFKHPYRKSEAILGFIKIL